LWRNAVIVSPEDIVDSRKVFITLLVLVSIVAAAAYSAQSSSGAIPSQALSRFLSTLPPDFPVYGAQIYPLRDGSTELALLTAAPKSGWQIRIYSYGKTGEFTIKWKSDPFPPEFAVSSSDNFRGASADPVRESAEIEFSGCKAHDCPGSFGALIYSPSRNRAFQAIVRNGAAAISPELNRPENKPLKDYLVKKIKAMAHPD
jgi:hypothetical protein